jgi:CheY-like chemotaxis protein
MLSMVFSKVSDQPATRVVVVEDDENDRGLLIRQLRKSKIEDHVRFFADGKSALQFLSNLPPPAPFCDLIAIFLDLNLPGISGVKLLREVRKMPRLKHTPVVIMTTSINPKDFEECQDLKVAAYIPKPVTFELFSQAITRLPHLPTFASTQPNPTTRLHSD